MLTVSIHIHSAVDGRMEELGNLRICNDATGTAQLGNYYVLDEKGNKIAEVIGHERSRGIWPLLARAAQKRYENEMSKVSEDNA